MRYKRLTFGTRSFDTSSKSRPSSGALPSLNYFTSGGKITTQGIFTPHPKHFDEYTYNKELDIWVERQYESNRIYREILIPETSGFFNYDFFSYGRGAVTNVLVNGNYPHLATTMTGIRYKFLDLLRKL
jgi:hypothetical protein